MIRDLSRLATVLLDGMSKEADTLLEAMWQDASPGDQRVILLELAVVGAGRIPSIDRALVWSSRFRSHELAEWCPLVAIATDPGRLPSQRIRAAAVAHATFDDLRVIRPLQDAARELIGTVLRARSRKEVEQLDPPLLAHLDTVWAEPAEPEIPIHGNWASKASIIIPLFNQVAFTATCLQFLVEVTTPENYEIVLVDNGSTDGTPELCAAQTGNVQVISNEVNLGFARACNQGAAAAKGEVLVFLNNDTEARPGWLRALLNVLELLPDVGIVGAKLIFPNGTIQHAGGLLVRFEDPEFEFPLLNLHRCVDLPADHPMADVRRDLQIVTGAAMAVRRETFESAGGFDEEYWNGGEDVELCLSARAAGWRVVYEPDSLLVHHEKTSGPERQRKQPENMLRLADRWLSRAMPDTLVHLDGTNEHFSTPSLGI